MPSSQNDVPIGEQLRKQRVETLKRGLRETAALLEIAPAHLTDIEKGRRSPSDELLLKIAKVYELPEPLLRSSWNKPDSIVRTIASESPTTAAKVPEFLREARHLTPEQWDRLIMQAGKMASEGKGGEP